MVQDAVGLNRRNRGKKLPELWVDISSSGKTALSWSLDHPWIFLPQGKVVMQLRTNEFRQTFGPSFLLNCAPPRPGSNYFSRKPKKVSFTVAVDSNESPQIAYVMARVVCVVGQSP